MYYKCCICSISRKDATLFHFPCSEERRLKWLKCIRRDHLTKMSSEQLSKLFVCQKHFEKKFLTKKFRLLGIAYPSLFTVDEISSGRPSMENDENLHPQSDHTYHRKMHFDHTYSKQEPLREISSGWKSSADNIIAGPSQIQLTKDDLEFPRHSGKEQNLPGTSQSQPHLKESDSNKVAFATSQKPRKKRLITKVKDLTPTCQIIYKEFKKSQKQLDFLKRSKRAFKFTKEQTFEKLSKNMNPYAKKIMKMQINLCTKNKKGRRFTTEEKLIALSIMKQSPKCYRFLRKMFILPSRATLNAMISKLNIQTGICSQVFGLIKKEVATWDEKKRFCSIIFDEVSLESALTYDKNRDKINGFVELQQKKNEFADHALVFMLRGAVHKWQQPIAFYFCQGATKGVELKNILSDIISAVVECGLKPIAIICDQGAAFQSALKSLKDDTKRSQILENQEPDGTITVNGTNLYILFDPSHLIKGLRNNFLNKNIAYDGKISKWQDIIDIYKMDCNHTEARLLHKLNDQHVIPEKIKKMKVKNCVKVFSSTVSAALLYTAKFSHYADGRPVSTTLENTAEIILFFDKLFDSLNGSAVFSKRNKGKYLRKAVTENSPHHIFWRDAIEKLKKIKFVDLNGKEKSVPSLKNYIITLKSYMGLWELLKRTNVRIMRPKYFNSDPIENFFGQVRAYNYRHNDPDCHSFICTFKSLLITRTIKFHNDSFNCEDDPAKQVINLNTLFDEESTKATGSNHPKTNSIEMIVEQARRERMNVHSRAYTAGWVVRKIINKLNIRCDKCKKCLTSKQTNIHDWISHREFNKSMKRLNYPSEGAVKCFGAVISETNEYLEHYAHNNSISLNIKNIIMSKYSFDFIDCTEHKEIVLSHFIALTVRFTIMNWCSTINKILKGTDVIRLENRILPNLQQKAYAKFKKKLKNKSFNK